MPRFLIALVFLPIACIAQVTGSFALERPVFAPGEPAFLSFTMKNSGKQTVDIQTADPYSFCSGYTIHVSRDEKPEPACFASSWGGSCVSGSISLAPGASRTERILLNYPNRSQGDIRSAVSAPGHYTIDATRSISYFGVTPKAPESPSKEPHDIHQVLRLTVDDTVDLPPKVYEPFVGQLASPDDAVRRDAARTLATFAPSTLEALLITFATSKDYVLREFAPLALTTLNTKASLSALATMLLHSQPGSYEYVMAAAGLGRTHDIAWLPLLLEVADQNGAMYLRYAAESGQAAAVPFLVSRLHDTDVETREAAIYALGQTGSRSAVPLLIELLPAGDAARNEAGKQQALVANVALQELTHRIADQGEAGSAIPGWHDRWRAWWVSEGTNTEISEPSTCSTHASLP